MRLFEVGGHVRDSLLGIKSKDIDIAVEASSYQEMKEYVENTCQKIFQERPEYFSIRALDADGLPKDFVLCRRDGFYSDNRRPDSVEIGTIYDDINRRDFTINSIARELSTGELLDPHNGQRDLQLRLIRCVGDTFERLSEDPLRLLRAIRFAITKDFQIDQEIENIMLMGFSLHTGKAISLDGVSDERIQEELTKCFRCDTIRTISFLDNLAPRLKSEIFNKVWLKPTLEKK